MIAALLGLMALLLMGGGGAAAFKEAEKNVKEYVVDEDRREAVLEAGEQLGDELEALEQRLNDHFTELVEAHRAFDSGAADFDAITVRLKEDQGAVAEVFLDTREAMREHMTREEWAAVFGAEKK